MQVFSVLPDWLVVLKNTVKILFLGRCRRAPNCNVLPKSGVAVGGLRKEKKRKLGPLRGGGGAQRVAAGGLAQAATNQTAGWGTAALGRKPEGAVTNGGVSHAYWVTVT